MNMIAVDDERPALRMLENAIKEAVPDCSLACFSTAAEALEYAKKTRIDIAFLDIHMPGISGLEFAKALTGIHANTNILFVTGYAEHALEAMSMGASGYIVKPPDPESIIVELGRLRYPISDGNELKRIHAIGPYTFDHTTNRVYYNGNDALLKPKEFQLLCVFAANPEKCFTAEELYQKIWGNDPNNSVQTVTVHISGIRKKLEMDLSNNPNIKTQRGKGYYLSVESEA